MCGIAGVVALDGGEVAPDDVRAMVAALAHRGPDATGFHAAPGVALGMARLAIIDLATGDQPMSGEGGRRWLVMNGEIYNFPALRARLEGLGHAFRTRSDTEVAVRALDEWGDGGLAELRGVMRTLTHSQYGLQ